MVIMNLPTTLSIAEIGPQKKTNTKPRRFVKNLYQVILCDQTSSPIVGGHDFNHFKGSRKFTSPKGHDRRIARYWSVYDMYDIYLGLSPCPVTVTTRILTFLGSGIPTFLNLHLPRLHPGRGGQPNVYHGSLAGCPMKPYYDLPASFFCAPRRLFKQNGKTDIETAVLRQQSS